jgi:hypothetical protein
MYGSYSAAAQNGDSGRTSIERWRYLWNTLVANPMPNRPNAQEVNEMGLTRDFKETNLERVRRDPDFANALLDEAATAFLNGEP